MYGELELFFLKAARFWFSTLLCAFLFISGCGKEMAGVLDEKTTAVEAKLMLDRASEMRPDAAVSNPLPDTYRRPPEVLQTSKGWKVFYYARNHSPKSLAALVKGQLKNEISESEDANLLIVNCADQQDVNQALQYLESVDVAPIQVKIDCIIVEHYADVTMDRETQIKVNEVLQNGDNHDFVIGGSAEGYDGSKGWGWFPAGSIREEKRSEFGMAAGYDGDHVKFMVDMLVSRGYLKVLMNPVVETVTGKPAYIMSKDQVPTTKQVKQNQKDVGYLLTEYIWVEDSLKVVPQVYADGSVSLSCEAMLSSKNTPEGVTQLPILTERKINIGENRIMPGKSLIIGGFRKSEKSTVIRGFPFLKDIPIIGVLFSSKDFEERAKEVTFILTPSISTKGIAYSEMLEQVAQSQALHTDPNLNDNPFKDILSDPFGKDAYAKQMQKEKEAETIKKLKYDIESAQSEQEALIARERLEEYKAKLKREEELKQKAAKQTDDYKEKITNLEDLSAKLKEQTELQKKEYEQTLEKTKQDTELTVSETQELSKQAQQVQQSLSDHQKTLADIEQMKAAYQKEKQTLQTEHAKLREEIEKIEKAEIERAALREKELKEKQEAAEKAQAEPVIGPVAAPQEPSQTANSRQEAQDVK